MIDGSILSRLLVITGEGQATERLGGEERGAGSEPDSPARRCDVWLTSPLTLAFFCLLSPQFSRFLLNRDSLFSRCCADFHKGNIMYRPDGSVGTALSQGETDIKILTQSAPNPHPILTNPHLILTQSSPYHPHRILTLS